MEQGKKDLKLECSECGHELTLDIQIDIQHVHDHVMSCPECYDAAIDFIFNEFTKIGIAANPKGIEELLKQYDRYLQERADLMMEED